MIMMNYHYLSRKKYWHELIIILFDRILGVIEFFYYYNDSTKNNDNDELSRPINGKILK